MQIRWLVAIAVAAVASFVAVVAAAGGLEAERVPAAAGTETAAPFVRNVVRLIAQNRYGDAWPLLHPSQRRVARRPEYVTCERQSPIAGRLVSVRVGPEFSDPVVLAPGRVVASRAVPVHVALLDLATREQTTVRDIVHAVRVRNRWTWVLPPERLARYRAGVCPDVPPPTPWSG